MSEYALPSAAELRRLAAAASSSPSPSADQTMSLEEIERSEEEAIAAFTWYLSGDAPPELAAQAERILADYPEFAERMGALRAAWAVAPGRTAAPPDDVDAAWAQLQRRIAARQLSVTHRRSHLWPIRILLLGMFAVGLDLLWDAVGVWRAEGVGHHLESIVALALTVLLGSVAMLDLVAIHRKNGARSMVLLVFMFLISITAWILKP